MSIVLIGMMGVGKSTLGRAASKALGWKFIDIDHEVEQSAKRSIPEIFANEGESAFREMETDTIARFSGKKNLVVATGGGAPVRQGNLALMREIGPVVYLEAGCEALTRRLKNSRTRRPMLGDDIDGRVRQLLDEREPTYREADFRIQVDESSPMAIVLEIKRIAEVHS
ncbi:MAG: shikimate kinase [Armatimonadota bacterium]|nr:shikimate kinase [Armatimonadota bacterium]